ncbi:MAG: four helix bundle protein [Candidatus Spechtbacterales bacterium]
MAVTSFKELMVWQRAMELTKEIYLLTSTLPQDERFGISSQLRRASVSIPSNIAEGRSRGTRKDFVQFLRIADGSAAELETQILLLRELYPNIKVSNAESLLEEVQKMLSVMIRKLKAQS